MLDYHIQTALEHRTRWPAALVRVWDVRGRRGELSDEEDRPGVHAENVFDFHDGLRLLVSTDQFDWGNHLHVSASARPESRVWLAVRKGMKPDALVQLVRERVYFLSERTVTLGFWTEPKGIPHFFDPPLPLGAIPWSIPTKPILGCAPVKPIPGMPPYVVRPGSTVTACSRCGQDCWLGPRQRALRDATGYVVLCFPCALATGHTPENTQHLGG